MEKYVVGFFGIVWGPSRGGMGAGVRTFSEGHGKQWSVVVMRLEMDYIG